MLELLRAALRSESGERTGSYEPALRHRGHIRVADDQVIEDADIDDCAGIAQPRGDEFIGLRRLGNP